jgi:light-regulated signal transduction histidine kinase (bacteriophytochrome)
MTQRGYAETNRWLERLNGDLRQEVAAKERFAAELRDANEELEAFSYSVAHDLRAPLRSIQGFGQILLDQHSQNLQGDAAHLLERIIAAERRMTELIDGLLALSHATRGELVSQSVDLAARARAIAAGLTRENPERGVVFEIDEPMVALGDPRLLGAALENLIGNAWKFTSRKAVAHIRIGVDRSGSPPIFFVRDDGAGFDMSHASKLFGVFQRLHAQDAFPGTGVGLATVQRIVRRHGGRIWAEGSVDGGASFFFTLADH